MMRRRCSEIKREGTDHCGRVGLAQIPERSLKMEGRSLWNEWTLVWDSTLLEMGISPPSAWAYQLFHAREYCVEWYRKRPFSWFVAFISKIVFKSWTRILQKFSSRNGSETDDVESGSRVQLSRIFCLSVSLLIENFILRIQGAAHP